MNLQFRSNAVGSFIDDVSRQAKNLSLAAVVRFLTASICVVLLSTVAAAGQFPGLIPGTSPLAGRQYVDNQVIIKFTEGIKGDQKLQLLAELNAIVVSELPLIGARLLQISGITVNDAVSRFRNDPRVAYIEPNAVLHVDIIPNDPSFDLLWGMNNTGQTGGTPDADIDAPEGWNIAAGTSVIIGDIDTGVDTTHQDLLDNLWRNPGEIPDNGFDDDSNGYVDDVFGWDFANSDNLPLDDYGHGTHTAGTMAAIGNNGIGVAGVFW